MAKTPKGQQRAADPVAGLRRLQDAVARLHVEAMKVVLPTKAEQIARQWMSRRAPEDDEEREMAALNEALVLAMDLETFAPSQSGATALDRLARRKPLDAEEQAAFRALKQARFTPFRLQSRIGPDLVAAENLATGQPFTFFDAQFPPAAFGVPLVARLVPLDPDRLGLAGVATPLDDAALAIALDFVRPGKGTSNDHRCASAVYKHVVRHGAPQVRGVNVFDEPDEPREISALDGIVLQMLKGEVPRDLPADIVDEVRRLTSIDTLLDALFKATSASDVGVPQLGTLYRRFAELQIETLHLRALAGTGRDPAPLDSLARSIDQEIALNGYPREARALFREIRKVVTAVKPKAEQEDLTRVIERIRGLRAKTIDQGCTEEEAMAAANKVAELLDRYGLSLGEIDLRGQACHGVGIETARKRPGPMEDCLPAVAAFCDCRAWLEMSDAATIRPVLFGLPADVEAARFLYERVCSAFETETATFRSGELYAELAGPERREATKSFQMGLSRGISQRLRARKAERDATTVAATGRDLVPVKASVIDEELAKLGLAFKAGGMRRGRRLLAEAFEAGQVAGLTFEAEEELEVTNGERAARPQSA